MFLIVTFRNYGKILDIFLELIYNIIVYGVKNMINTDIIIIFIKMYIINISVYYCITKIININNISIMNRVIILMINFIWALVYTLFKSIVNPFFPFIILVLVYTVILSKLTSNSFGYSLLVVVMSYALSLLCHTIAVAIQFIPYKLLETHFNITNLYISLIIITTIQLVLIYAFFKIKRFKNGFSSLNNKLNNEITEIITLNISAIVIMIYCLFKIGKDETTMNLFAIILLLTATMYMTIQKMLTMHYKQKLLTDTMEEYKKELGEKQNEIDILKAEKKNISKITHDFYNRQKALELLVASNMNVENIKTEGTSQNVLNIIELLTNEYSARFEAVKELPRLEQTEIPEIDNMLKYMQSECYNNGISFKLKIMGNIHYLINNIIPKNRLETLIGDHLRDAINATNLSTVGNKEILAILGIKEKKYEFSVFDMGVDFNINTLNKLGLEPVTTNSERGGTGTGFMTTFETLDTTKASLIITEYPKDSNNAYTKCVTIRFDGKKQYKIYSYRYNELKESCDNNRIKIEQLED